MNYYNPKSKEELFLCFGLVTVLKFGQNYTAYDLSEEGSKEYERITKLVESSKAKDTFTNARFVLEKSGSWIIDHNSPFCTNKFKNISMYRNSWHNLVLNGIPLSDTIVYKTSVIKWYHICPHTRKGWVYTHSDSIYNFELAKNASIIPHCKVDN